MEAGKEQRLVSDSVQRVLARAQEVVSDPGLEKSSGCLERVSEDTGEYLKIIWDDENNVKGIRIGLKVGPTALAQLMDFTPDGTARIQFKKNRIKIYNPETGINMKIQPPSLRSRFIGCIALAPEVLEDLVKEEPADF